MKFAAIIEYGSDNNSLKASHPAHRAYLRTYLENGQLRAAGPFADDAGALWVLDAENAEAAEQIATELLVSSGGEGRAIAWTPPGSLRRTRRCSAAPPPSRLSPNYVLSFPFTIDAGRYVTVPSCHQLAARPHWARTSAPSVKELGNNTPYKRLRGYL
jgi:uncharacterized protein YciI